RAHPESALNTLASAEGDVTGRTAFDAAAQGDAAGQAVVNKYIHYLAVGVANLINIFFPEVIGLSGGVANQGENLLRPLRAAVEPMVFG
ncbi:ROK family protein, partial [Staphylococcus aureus]|uniref:ROK family protein n=1 Tax=Staphylococcus aureus TaxID=1280 RepID=UPI002149709F